MTEQHNQPTELVNTLTELVTISEQMAECVALQEFTVLDEKSLRRSEIIHTLQRIVRERTAPVTGEEKETVELLHRSLNNASRKLEKAMQDEKMKRLNILLNYKQQFKYLQQF